MSGAANAATRNCAAGRGIRRGMGRGFIFVNARNARGLTALLLVVLLAAGRRWRMIFGW